MGRGGRASFTFSPAGRGCSGSCLVSFSGSDPPTGGTAPPALSLFSLRPITHLQSHLMFPLWAGSSHHLPRACRDALEFILPALLWEQAACRSIWRALPADAPLKTSPRPAGMPGIHLIPCPAGVTHPQCPGSWGLFVLSEQPWSAPAALPGPAALPWAFGVVHHHLW